MKGISGFFSKLYKGFILVLCLVLLGSVSLFTYMKYTEYGNLKAIESELLASIEKEKAAQEQLDFEMEYSMTDTYIEKVARERLGLVKETDIIFVNENE